MKRSEVFRRTLRSADAYQTFRRATLGHRIGSVVAPYHLKRRYLHWLWSTTGTEAVGFRLMYDQLRRTPSLHLLIRTQGIRLIHLVRTNVLATHLSAEVAKETGRFMSRSPDRESPTIALRTDDLVRQLGRRQRRIDSHRRVIRSLPHVEVAYEDYATEAEAIDSKILAFLQVDPSLALRSDLERLGSRPLSERILNIDDVHRTLDGTEFAACLSR